MKKTVICNIPMKKDLDKMVYPCVDPTLPLSKRAVSYPVNAYLERIMEKDDEIKVILLIKKDPERNYLRNAEAFVGELMAANENIGARITQVMVESEFDESRSVHEELLGRIVDEIENGSHIISDITYGPKDLPIVLFTALNFAEKYLDCEIDNIVYGQVDFIDKKPANPRFCDMAPLYYLNSITNTVRVDDPDKAREILKRLISV